MDITQGNISFNDFIELIGLNKKWYNATFTEPIYTMEHIIIRKGKQLKKAQYYRYIKTPQATAQETRPADNN